MCLTGGHIYRKIILKGDFMKKKLQKSLIFLVILVLFSNCLTVLAIDTLNPSDFQLDNWNKEIDFFDYVREYASLHGETPPAANSHAYLNLAYVNTSGLQMLSAGLCNITDEEDALTIPIQTTMMHYKSRDNLKDIVTASSFVMLMAFNESENTLIDLQPDRSDTLYASFSLGYDLDDLFDLSKRPDLNSSTEVIPLESSQNGQVWTWGMKYNDLAAFWWKTSIDPSNPARDPRPIALTIYDELTFTYRLQIDSNTGEATLSMNYTVGRMRDLWVFWWLVFVPVTVHYNSTGCYRLNGEQISEETIHNFLRNHGIKMSIVNFQATVILNHTAYFESQGANVQDEDVYIDSSIEAFADDGEKIYEADFETKKTYDLYNYTSDEQENTFETYEIEPRTCKIGGFARNPIFGVHTSLLRLIPVVLANMHPELYEQAKDHLLDMNYADYFYITSYSTYDGYRIGHDPTITAYCYLTTGENEQQTLEPGAGTLIIFGLIIALIIVVVSIILRKKG
jgi:hypothetical protein